MSLKPNPNDATQTTPYILDPTVDETLRARRGLDEGTVHAEILETISKHPFDDPNLLRLHADLPKYLEGTPPKRASRLLTSPDFNRNGRIEWWERLLYLVIQAATVIFAVMS